MRTCFWSPDCRVQECSEPLQVVVAAGAIAFPQLLKVTKIAWESMIEASPALDRCRLMPFELSLGQEFAFHSMFACPVSKELSPTQSVPMMLPCGHVLSQTSIVSMLSVHQTLFKCPYCPEETEARLCSSLQFAPVR